MHKCRAIGFDVQALARILSAHVRVAAFIRISRLSIVCGLVVLVFSASGGERVIFSKPGAGVATPVNPDSVTLPTAPNEFRHFGDDAKPALDLPYIPSKPRIEPRKGPRKNIFGDPVNPFVEQKESDGEKEKGQDDGATAQTRDTQKPLYRFPDLLRKQEQDRALAPIRQFDLAPDEKDKDSARKEKTTWSNHDGNAGSLGAFGTQRDKDDDKNDGSIFGFFKGSSKHELTKEQLERRVDFEKLLNPSFAPLARNGGSANDSPFDAMKAQTQGPSPIMAPNPMIQPERRSLDPMQGFADQQRTWRGPSVDDLNRKMFGAPSVSSTPTVAHSLTPTKPPLMQQPVNQNFPTRPF